MHGASRRMEYCMWDGRVNGDGNIWWVSGSMVHFSDPFFMQLVSGMIWHPASFAF